MQAIWDQFLDSVKTYAPSLAGAILILIVGWLVAKAIAGIVRRGLGRTKIGSKITRWIGGEGAQAIEVERRVAKVVYYLVMLLVLVAFFQVLGLTIATEPLNRLLNTVFEFIPKIVGAAILILIAWIIASVLRLVIVKVLSGAQIDERFGKKAGVEEEKRVPLSKMIGDVVYWLIFLSQFVGIEGCTTFWAAVFGKLSQIVATFWTSQPIRISACSSDHRKVTPVTARSLRPCLYSFVDGKQA